MKMTGKEIFFTLCEKYIAGAIFYKIGKQIYGTPKTYIVFLVAFLTTLIGDVNKIGFLSYLGYILITVGFLSFFYYNIFPHRRPKSPFD